MIHLNNLKYCISKYGSSNKTKLACLNESNIKVRLNQYINARKVYLLLKDLVQLEKQVVRLSRSTRKSNVLYQPRNPCFLEKKSV